MDNPGQARQITSSHNWKHGENSTGTLHTEHLKGNSGFPSQGSMTFSIPLSLSLSLSNQALVFTAFNQKNYLLSTYFQIT